MLRKKQLVRKFVFELGFQLSVKTLQNFLSRFLLLILNVSGGGCIYPKVVYGHIKCRL